MDTSRSHTEVADQNPKQITISDLPYDVLFELFNYLSATDVSFLLSTCKMMHRHMQDLSIWQRLAARYGLRDLTRFRGLSAYTVYTQLLHPYGPLLGLWASDYPYKGNIIEFRLLAADDAKFAGIIGEVWKFPEVKVPDGLPSLPEYAHILTISLDPPWSAIETRDASVSATARVYCSAATQSAEAATHMVSIELLPPTNQGLFLQGYRRTFSHPDFPCEGASWYDGARGLPHLKLSSPLIVDQRELVRIYPAVRLPIIFTSSTSCTKPAAISIHCLSGPSDECSQLYQPPVPFDDLAPAPPRYYPLKRTIQKGVDPDCDDWSLESLAGLWLGVYGQRETECLYAAWDSSSQELRACKITGDINVPRGAHSWTAKQSDTVYPPLFAATMLGMDPAVHRVFAGVGTTSERGFVNATVVDIVVGVPDADKITIWWDHISDLRTYIRYKGRKEHT